MKYVTINILLSLIVKLIIYVERNADENIKETAFFR